MEAQSPLGRGVGVGYHQHTMKRKNILPYNPILKDLAREVRNNSTLSEVLLWQHLKGSQMLGYDFDL